MGITLTWQSLITAAGVAGAVGALAALFAKLVRWVDRQKKQDAEIAALKKQHRDDLTALEAELTLITYGLLAALKGLKEQGCNGPVSEAVQKIEKYLNNAAHKL